MTRIDAAGNLVARPVPTTQGRVVARYEYEGSKSIPGTAAGQHEIWKPDVPVKAGHLYWVVGSITLRWAEHDVSELVVWRSNANDEILKVKYGGGRNNDSHLGTTFPTYISAMFVPDKDATESIWFVVNTPADNLATGSHGMYLYDDFSLARIQHNIYIIDMGPADALVLDFGSGHRIDNAGALSTVQRTSSLVAADTKQTEVRGTAGGQDKILSATWDPKPGHQYLVIAAFTGVHLPDNTHLHDYWLHDKTHGTNPIRTRLGTYWGPSRNPLQMRPVVLVKVIDGGGEVEVWGSEKTGDGNWLTMNQWHRLVVLDLGEK